MKYSHGEHSMTKHEPTPVWMTDAEGPHASQQVLATPMALAKVLWRRKLLVIGCVAAAVVVASFYIRRATPMYTAGASVRVERAMRPLMGQALEAAPGTGSAFLLTERSILVSTPVLSAAANSPAVKALPTFNGPNAAGDPVGYLKNGLGVEVGKDALIYVTLSCPNPTDAATLVNRVVDAYVAHVGAQSRSTAGEALKVLTREREKAQAEWRTKTDELIEFKRTHGALAFANGDGNIVIQRLAKLSEELTRAEVEVTEAQGAYKSQNAVGIARLRLAAAEGRVTTLRAAFEEQQKAAMALNADEAELLRLQSELTRVAGYANDLESRIKEIGVAQDAGGASVKVVEAAVAPTSPSAPQKMRILLAAIVMGLLSGVGLAWVRDWTDPRLRGTDEMIATLGMPVLGMIPHMNGRQSAPIRGRKVQLEFMSEVAEAYRTLRTSIYFGTRNEPARTLLVTSPSQGDGKSTTASNLAIAMAQAGRRTLIVDTDFRRPQLHKIFEIKDEVGLSSVLAGRETLDKAIHATGVKGLEILPCGPIPSNPSEILNSDAFAKLLMSLATRYDMIVLDSPPVSPVTDARILGAICDATLLVLKSDKSTRKSATMSADALHSVGARVLGVVCNGVTRKSGSDRYYTGYGYGYPRQAQARLAEASAARRLPATQMTE